jgi:dihydrofolate reductase
MRTIILMVHLSLDGYVAGPLGDLSYFNQNDENLAFVNTLTNGADAALFGRNSYKLLNDFWPEKRNDLKATQAEIDYSNWYNSSEKIVVSTTLQASNERRLTIIGNHLETELLKIKQQEGKNILIFGSPSLSETLMTSNLIDEFQIFIHPIFFGQGLPLFAKVQHKTILKLLTTKLLPNGEIVAHYIKKQKPDLNLNAV